MPDRNIGFYILITIAGMLTIMFLTGQTYSLFNYQAAVDMGLQEAEEEVSRVGIAFLKGFAFGDTIVYIPLMVAGIIGLLMRRRWGGFVMNGALAISIYWPGAVLYAIFVERQAITLNPDKYISFSILLPLIMIYGSWGMWYLYKKKF